MPTLRYAGDPAPSAVEKSIERHRRKVARERQHGEARFGVLGNWLRETYSHRDYFKPFEESYSALLSDIAGDPTVEMGRVPFFAKTPAPIPVPLLIAGAAVAVMASPTKLARRGFLGRLVAGLAGKVVP